MHGDRFYDGGVVVSRSLEDDGDLPVNVGLGEGAFGLPAIGGEESHLDVIWRMMGDGSETKQALKRRAVNGAISGSPFCTLSHRRKISSPPFTLPLFLLTRQILSSAVFGAPDDAETNSKQPGGSICSAARAPSDCDICVPQFKDHIWPRRVESHVTCLLSEEEVLYGNRAVSGVVRIKELPLFQHV